MSGTDYSPFIYDVLLPWGTLVFIPTFLVVYALLRFRDRPPKRVESLAERRLRHQTRLTASYQREMARFDRRVKRSAAKSVEKQVRQRAKEEAPDARWRWSRPARLRRAVNEGRRWLFEVNVEEARASAGTRLRERFDAWDAEEDTRIDTSVYESLRKLYPNASGPQLQAIVEDAHRRPQDTVPAPRMMVDEEGL